MFALIVEDRDPAGHVANVVRELFANNPRLHPSLDVRDVTGITGIAVGWIANSNGSIAAYVAAAPTATDLLAYAESKRWKKEIGGITVSGIPVLTDDRSKQMIMGARIAAAADATFTAHWAGADGNVYVLTATQIIGISNAVLAHVNNCFTIFASVKAAIDGGSTTTLAAIDAAFA